MYAHLPEPRTRTFYCHALVTLEAARVPALVGGGYALEHYTGIVRPKRDLDVFLRRADCGRALAVLAAAGYRSDLAFPHWLAKVYCDDDYIDLIYSSGNGLAEVDDEWFEHARQAAVLDLRVELCPPEELIWSHAFVMEHERYDGAEVAHLLRACGPSLDWRRLLRRFGAHWRVLLSHLVLFGFVYPMEGCAIPEAVTEELLRRLEQERSSPPPADRLCQGSLLSRAQYRVDVDRWGYRDARLPPTGRMTPEEIAGWTAAIPPGV